MATELTHGNDPDRCAYWRLDGQPCPHPVTHNGSWCWPKGQRWSANYCGIHILDVAGRTDTEITELDTGMIGRLYEWPRRDDGQKGVWPGGIWRVVRRWGPGGIRNVLVENTVTFERKTRPWYPAPRKVCP